MLEDIFPVFAIVAFGWILAFYRIIDKRLSKELIKFAYYAAGPALIFTTISNYHISQVLVWSFWSSYIITILLIGILTFCILALILNQGKIYSVYVGFANGAKNSLMMGLPVLYGCIGTRSIIPVAITVIVFNCILTPVIIFFSELTNFKLDVFNKKETFTRIFGRSITNPLIVAALLGIIFSICHIHLPMLFGKSLQYLGQTFSPCALFSVGIDLMSVKINKAVKRMALNSFLNLMLCPLIAILVAEVLEISPLYAVSLIVLSSMPTAKSMYIYAKKYSLFEHEIAELISCTTLLSLFTIPVFLYISYRLWPSAFY